MQEALRAYLDLAMGLTETSQKRVRRLVKEAVGKGGATAEQARTLTTELLALNSANRDALGKLVRFEVDRALGLVGLATADEVQQLTTRVRDLEQQLRDARRRADYAEQIRDSTGPAQPPASQAAPPARKVAKKAVKKAAVKKAGERPSSAAAPAPRKAPTKKAAAKANARRSA